MLSINLLPLDERQALRAEEAVRAVIFFTVLTVAVFAVGLVFLAPSFLTVRFTEGELRRSLELEENTAGHKSARDTILRARAAGEALAEIRSYAADPVRASKILERFFVPGEGVTVQSLLVRKSGELALTGHAATRGQLLRFEEALRASDRFHEITFPLSNITRERDIQFAVQGKLKPEYGL